MSFQRKKVENDDNEVEDDMYVVTRFSVQKDCVSYGYIKVR